MALAFIRRVLMIAHTASNFQSQASNAATDTWFKCINAVVSKFLSAGCIQRGRRIKNCCQHSGDGRLNQEFTSASPYRDK